jgi:2-dehydropantoate 2-reductase
MWDKWVLLATLAGMTCLMRGSVGDIVATQAGAKLMLALLAECASVAAGRGLRRRKTRWRAIAAC